MIGKTITNMLNTQEAPSDELKEDYCEKCNTRTSVIVELLGEKRKMGCICECEQRKMAEEKLIEENRQKQMRLDKLRINSLMDKKFEQCKFENWKMDDLNKGMYKTGINYTENWNEMKSKNIGFIFHGAVGIGKTYLVSCIANKLLEQYIPVVITSSIALLGRFKKAYADKEAEINIINNLQSADLLIIDDLGAENDTDWVKEKLYEVIDSRYRNSKPTIITTNLTLDQLRKKLTGDDGVTRTYDRLLEMCYPLKVEGTSKRVNAYKDKKKIINELILNKKG